MTMVFKLMVTISIYESLSRSLMAYATCVLRRHGLRSLFSAFDRICYADGIMPYEQPLRRWVVVSTSLAFVITTCGISLEVYGVYGSQDAQQLFQIHKYQGQQRLLFMVALCNRADYFHPVVSFYLLSFPRLISAAAHWMSTILRHMVWP